MKNLKVFKGKNLNFWFLRSLQKRRSYFSLKIRSFLLWFIRPINRNSNYLVFRQEPIVHIMSIGIVGTILMVIAGYGWPSEAIPFGSAFVLNVFLSYFFKWFPMSWQEMDEYEKQYIRKIFGKEKETNWTPYSIKITK
jgi:hypothetical protein